MKWFAQPDRAEEVVVPRGLLLPEGRVERPGFPASAPFAGDFLVSMNMVKDFWAEPIYATLLLDMQKRVHDFVCRRQGHTRRTRSTVSSRTGPRISRMGQAVRDKLPGNATRAEAAAGVTELRSSMSAPDGSSDRCLCSVSARSGPMTRSGGMSDRAIAWLFISPTILLLLTITSSRDLDLHMSLTNYKANMG